MLTSLSFIIKNVLKISDILLLRHVRFLYQGSQTWDLLNDFKRLLEMSLYN